MNAPRPQFRTVLIGCGAISRKHIAALNENAGAYEVVGAFDVDADRAAQAAAAVREGAAGKACRAFTDMDEMARESGAEVAVIATPSALHADQAVYWMERGAHLVLEKPVALCTQDMDRIARAKERHDRKIAVGYVARYAPQIRLVAKALAAGRFGRVFHVGLAIYWNRNDDYYRSASWRGTWEHDGGSLMNQATHGIDLLQWILGGRPTLVTGRIARFMRPVEADDFAAATITFEGGAIGTMQATVDTYPQNLGTRLAILGETGTVELTGIGPDAVTAWRFPPDDEWRETDEAVAAGVIPPADGELAGHAGVYQDLAGAIANGHDPVASFESARISAEIVLGILKSHRDRTAVDFPLEFATNEMIGVEL